MDISLQMSELPKVGHQLKLEKLKMAQNFPEIFPNMKIWDICDHLQLVTCIFIKSPSNESILNFFQVLVKSFNLRKNIKKY